MTDSLARRMRHYAIFVAIIALPGCSMLATQPTPEPDPVEHEPVVVIETPPPVTEPNEPATKTIIPVVPEPPQLPPVAIVLTSGQPAYADVARELTRHLENYDVYDLSDSDHTPVSVLRLINDSDPGAVVAIGMRAARSSVSMSTKPVVFSQVFNYQDHGLLTENSRGVASIAPLDMQIAAWKQADPTISRIGAIVGEGHDDLITEAERAADRHGVEMHVHVTRSDQETLYFFKRMIRDIDGFWLFPDNRVLSRRVLSQIMDAAQQHQVAVLVPTESMLKIGATISVSSVPSNIADTIAEVIRQIQAGDIDQVPPISPLSESRVRTNETLQVVDR